MKKNDQINTIVLNTPKELKLELLFPEYRQTDLNKIIFLIHQINYYHQSGYQINIDNHAYFLSLTNGELTKIISRLVSAGVIKLSDKFLAGYKSNTYKMVSPFSILESNKHFFNSAEKTFPIFLKRWIADGNIVKSKKDSAYKKEVKVSSTEAELLKRIAELEAENEKLKTIVQRVAPEELVIESTPEPLELTEVLSHAKHGELQPVLKESDVVVKEMDGGYAVATFKGKDVVIADYSDVVELIGGNIEILTKQLLVPETTTTRQLVIIDDQTFYFDLIVNGNTRACSIAA